VALTRINIYLWDNGITRVNIYLWDSVINKR